MAAYRFRPQAALDLRRREEDAARLVAAEARAGSDRADAAVQAAHAAFAAASARAAAADAAGGDVTVAIWYRNWIRSQRRELVRAEAIAEERRVGLAAAEAGLVEARRRVRVLERLRDRARAAHEQRERQQEQRALDELANLQFAVRQRGDHP